MVGLIDKAKVATEKTEIAQEKEQIQNVITGFRLDNTQMNAENLQKELNNLSGNTDIKVEQVGENDFLVTFPSGRIYEVADGKVEYIGKEGELEDVIISVNKEQDLEEKQIQEVEVTINTYKNRDENQTVKLQYAWSDREDTRTSGYKSAILEGNNISKKAIISSGDLETGNYYLWLKVTVNGKTIEKTYGEYYIKKYPTLVRALNETQTTSGFLGNTDIQRGKIKTITLQNTLDGKNTDEGKCWDVSKEKKGEILAWYEEENIEGNIYYNVTIGAEGKIRANTNSSYLFAYIGNDVIGAEVKIEGLENLDTSNVTDMFYMFAYCRSLTSLDVSNFDTSKVTNMGSMFRYCEGLTSLDLSKFDTTNVTFMRQMFLDCEGLVSLNVSKFNTSSVDDMLQMFCGCSNLTSLDLSNFDTSNVTDMYGMFSRCKKLITLNIKKWKLNDNVELEVMFNGTNSNIVITVSSQEIKNKLMSIYEEFTDNNFQISE